MSKLKNRKELEGGLEKRKGKEDKKERKIKHTLKYLYEAKDSTMTGKNFRGGGGKEFFWQARIYTPVPTSYYS